MRILWKIYKYAQNSRDCYKINKTLKNGSMFYLDVRTCLLVFYFIIAFCFYFFGIFFVERENSYETINL